MSKRDRMPRFDWYAVRWSVLERDRFTCRYCGQCAPNVMLHVDHVIAVCEGGSDNLDNLVTACSACNVGKEMYRASVTKKAVARREGAPPVSYPMPSVDALRAALSDHPEGLTIYDLARVLGRNRSTLVRTVQRAIASGAPITVERVDSGGNPRHLYRLDGLHPVSP